MKLTQLILLATIALCSCTGYVVEHNVVYYKQWNEAVGSFRTKLPADAESFETLGRGYACDKAHVFRVGSIVDGADPKTFDIIDDAYATDKFRAYYYGTAIELSRPENFERIDGYYSTDRHDVFYTSKALHVCDAKKFRFVFKEDTDDNYQRWATDGCFYYLSEFKIPSDDYTNVRIFKNSAGFAKDKRWVYFLNHRINQNQDGKHILDTVDVATFEVTDYVECRDKFGCINVFHGREDCK